MQASVGRTGTEKAVALIRKAIEWLPDRFRGFIGDLGRLSQNLEAEGRQFADRDEL